VELPKGSPEGADPNGGPEDAGAGAGLAPKRGWLEVDVVADDDDPNTNGVLETGGGAVVVADPKAGIAPDAGGAAAADAAVVPMPLLCPNGGAPNVAFCPIPACSSELDEPNDEIVTKLSVGFDTGAGAGARVDPKEKTGFASRKFPGSSACPISEGPLERLRDPEVPKETPAAMDVVWSAVLVPKDGALGNSRPDFGSGANGTGCIGMVLLSGGRLSLACNDLIDTAVELVVLGNPKEEAGTLIGTVATGAAPGIEGPKPNKLATDFACSSWRSSTSFVGTCRFLVQSVDSAESGGITFELCPTPNPGVAGEM
jgi:hypothetical protein